MYLENIFGKRVTFLKVLAMYLAMIILYIHIMVMLTSGSGIGDQHEKLAEPSARSFLA